MKRIRKNQYGGTLILAIVTAASLGVVMAALARKSQLTARTTTKMRILDEASAMANYIQLATDCGELTLPCTAGAEVDIWDVHGAVVNKGSSASKTTVTYESRCNSAGNGVDIFYRLIKVDSSGDKRFVPDPITGIDEWKPLLTGDDAICVSDTPRFGRMEADPALIPSLQNNCNPNIADLPVLTNIGAQRRCVAYIAETHLDTVANPNVPTRAHCSYSMATGNIQVCTGPNTTVTCGWICAE